MKFNFFDIINLVIIGFSTFLGGYKGAIKVIIGFLMFVASVIAIIFIFPIINNYLGDYIRNKNILNTVTGIVAIFISMFSFSFIESRIVNSVGSTGFLDKISGLLLGLVRGCLFSLLIFVSIILIFSVDYKDVKNAHEVVNNVDNKKHPSWLTDSISFNFLENAYKNLLYNLPQEYLKNIKIPKNNLKPEDNTENNR